MNVTKLFFCLIFLIFCTSIASAETYSSQWGTKGSADGQFLSPTGIALDSSGNVYVVDSGNYRVQKFDKNGKFLMKFGSSGSGKGQFTSPQAITVDSWGYIYVNDNGNTRITKFNKNGKYVSQIDIYSWDICTDLYGNLYSSRAWYLDKYDKNGVLLSTASYKQGSVGFNMSIAIDKGMKFLTYDFVTRVNIDKGTSNKTWWPSSDTDYVSIAGIAANKYFYIVGNNRILPDVQRAFVMKYTEDGKYIGNFGTYGTGKGQFTYPVDIAVGNQYLYVLDQGTNRVERFTLK